MGGTFRYTAFNLINMGFLTTPFITAPARFQILLEVHPVHPRCCPMLMGFLEYWRYEVTRVAIVPDGVQPGIQQVKI